MNKIYDEIRRIAKKYHISKIILFGSRARGDNSPKSDIDIAVQFDERYCEKECAAFKLEIIEDIPTLYSIDVVCIGSHTDERLHQNIAEDGVVLYMREKKIEQYKKAVVRIREASKIFADNKNELYRDGLIQRFEFTFELAWKSIKEYLEEQGVSGDINFPRAVLKIAFSANIINDEKWLDMLNDRNMASHIYSEEIAEVISERIQSDYVNLLEKLIEKLEEIID